MNDPLCRLELASWAGPFSGLLREKACAALERGKVLVFPDLPFLFDASEQSLLSPKLSNGKSKNISLKPNGELSGTVAEGEDAKRLGAMMDRFAKTAARFVSALLPHYTGPLERARTSYRPVEIEGRAASVIHDDTRLHIDAFPSTPMRGRRILRIFTNVNPEGNPRVWRVGEPFADMAETLAPSVREGSGIHAGFLAAFRITKGRRSAYDRMMLGLHDAAKRDEAYQKTSPQIEVRFAPGTTWMCFTDQVMHAALSGQYVLEQTFHLDVAAMAEPQLSPLKVLERQRGRTLV
jgi:hypothetical protein